YFATLRKTLAEGEVLLSGTPYYIRQMKENRSDGATGQLVEKFQGDGTGFSRQPSQLAELVANAQARKFSRFAPHESRLLFHATKCGRLPAQSLESLPRPPRKWFQDQ